MQHTVFIGLGSNLQDPIGQIQQAYLALKCIEKTQLVTTSSLYESEPIGPAQPNFINSVAKLVTELAPETLLNALQTIELAQDRVRKEHWGPRTLDLDILLWDNDVIATDRLIVPHQFLKERNFVLIPLAEIAPELVLPCGSSINTLAGTSDQQSIRKLA